MRAPKYRNTKTLVDGVLFDSLKEARRYGELKLLERAGEIGDLQVQPAFPLMVSGRQVCKYIGDFSYRHRLPNGELSTSCEVEDVKSPHTRKLPVYRLKAKMFAAQYGFPIREV